MLAATCLALALYHEARGEPIQGRYAVAGVIMERAGDDPGKVCDVVSKPHQFSFLRPGARIEDVPLPPDGRAWQNAKREARAALNGDNPWRLPGATHYHALGILPYWAEIGPLKPVDIIGNHVFYAPKPGE